MHVRGNVYYNGTQAYKYEDGAVIGGNIPMPEIIHRPDAIVMKITADSSIESASTVLVDTKLLDKAYYPDSYFENRDGSDITIDSDYSGARRDAVHPKAGPFENLKPGVNEIVLWKFRK